MLRLFFFRGLLVLYLSIGAPLPTFNHGIIDGIGIACADDGGDGGGGGGGGDSGGDGVKWGNEPVRPLNLPDLRRLIPNFWSTAPAKQATPRQRRAKAPPPKSRKPPTQRQPPARAVAKIGDFEPREILAIDATQAVLNQARSLGFTIGRTESLSQLNLRITRLRTPANQSPPQSLRRLQRRIPKGDFVLNHVYRTAARPCPENRCYGSSLIGWDQAAGNCGRGAKLGMVDTAVNGKTPALAGQQVTTRSFADDGRASSPTHGTAVAALLVGAPDSGFPGLLPDAALYAADTFIGSAPDALRTNALLLSQGLDWLLAQQASVVNASLTGPDNRLLRLAIDRLSQRNIPVVAAAGNGGPNAPPAFPAAYPQVVAVTAVDQVLRPYRLANRGTYLTVAAPGVRIWTPGPRGGQYSDGTSFATPYVTAAAALLRHQQPHLTPAQLTQQLQGNARDLGAPGKDPVFGWGLLQSLARCDGSG